MRKRFQQSLVSKPGTEATVVISPVWLIVSKISQALYIIGHVNQFGQHPGRSSPAQWSIKVSSIQLLGASRVTDNNGIVPNFVAIFYQDTKFSNKVKAVVDQKILPQSL